MAKPGYALIIKTNPANFIDAQTNYLRQNTNSVSSQSKVPVPISGTIRKVFVNFTNFGTLGTTETGSLYLNKNGASSENLLSSSVKNDAVNTSYVITGLNVSVAAGDYINIQFDTPTRATNPTNVNVAATIWIE